MNLAESIQLESLRTPIFRKSEARVTKLPAKDIARKVIRASYERKDWLRRNIKSKEFILADIPLTSVAIIETNEKISVNASIDEKPIVVDVNKNKIGKSTGKSKTGYIPPVIVIEGAGQHTAARLNGKSTIKAWVGAEAAYILGIMADQFGSSELNDKLQELLREQFAPKKKSSNGDTISVPYPWIRETYPYENYFVYSYEGKLYKQKFTTDLKKREVKFDGDPEQVVQKYIDLDATTPIGKAMSMTPMGNVAVKKTGGFLYNGTSPGSGVGPRVQAKVNPRSEIANKGK